MRSVPSIEERGDFAVVGLDYLAGTVGMQAYFDLGRAQLRCARVANRIEPSQCRIMRGG